MKKLYALFFAIGAVCAAPYSVEEIHTSLEIVGVLMLVALVASLLVPFAAFSEKERTVEVVKYPTVVSAILLLASMSMHLSYWTAGLHSRKFRMDMFLTGVGQDRPDVVRRVTVLAALGRSQEADDIIRREMASWRSD
ncbi:MAG: hypothetical protein UY82_C0058G0006 [Candidatus Uhrbacteria bacterium GW2011_GWC2_53_7]|uniref:Uncharacterized protein n=1 Tax=Candidatus Uhrbacteria bacterium GW2011_GWC2_53_7 TaxID=1618986 RepID=A0A0G1XUZ5_9BACT|nr:MAG: hypothetical protein UY82_C0058G0006 [Candidatus Uhrbacteria bacterium GW2011_GWC2_53_7]